MPSAINRPFVLLSSAFLTLFTTLIIVVDSRILKQRTEDMDLNVRTRTFYNFTVKDENENDVSERMTIMHFHHDSQNQKRDVSRPMDQCLGHFAGWTAKDSACVAPQKWAIMCERVQPPIYTIIHRGDCFEYEICIDSIYSSNSTAYQRAYCVSKNNFVQFAQNALGGAAAENMHIPDPGGDAQVHRVVSEAVLTAADGRSEMAAKRLTLQALGHTHPDRPCSYVPLKDGSHSCLDCGRVSIDPIPPGTSLLHGEVVLETAGAAGVLFLATVSLG